MTIGQDGRVGIGTTDPDSSLHIIGNHDLGSGPLPALNIESNDTDNAVRTWRIRTDATAYGSIAIEQSTAKGGNTFTKHFNISEDGKVGIGDTAPNGILHVAEANDGGDTEIHFVNSAGEGSNDETVSLKFGTTADATPQELGRITFKRAGTYAENSQRKSECYFYLRDENVDKLWMYVLDNGAVRMPPTYSHGLAGTYRDLYIMSDGQLVADTSSEADKTEIKDIEDSSWIQSLRPVEFQFRKFTETEGEALEDGSIPTSLKRDSSEGDGVKHYGFIAEEVDDLDSTVVVNDEESGNPVALHYKELIAPLVKEVQKLSVKVEALENA
jgi:hypothetical protein